MMTSKMYQHLCFFLCACSISSGLVLAQDKIPAFSKPQEYAQSLFHVGVWVEDPDEMLDFLSLIMNYEVVMRAERNTGGKRIMIADKRGQIIELLSDPDRVTRSPQFPLHPQGRVAGVAHIAIHVDDVVALKREMQARGYQILAQAPEDFSQGYIRLEHSSHRILYVRGPSSISFELFEIRK